MSTDDTNAARRGSESNDLLGPFAELHSPQTEFEDGTWHKPLPQGWAGGTLVYTEEQMLARVAAERERWEQAIGGEMPADFKDWHQNSPAERPNVAAWVIRNLREREALAWSAGPNVGVVRLPARADDTN